MPRTENGAMRSPALRPTLVVVLVAIVAATLGACSSTGDESTTVTTTTTTTAASGPSGTATAGTATNGTTADRDPLAECPHRLPGELLTADEAVVRFSPTRICPGYVTVGLGTEVTFVNLGVEPYDVTIWSGMAAAASDTPLVTTSVAPGDRWGWTPPEVAVYTYRTGAIETMTGTIEVPA